CREGQTLDLVFVEIALVKIERRLSVELEHHVAFRPGDPATRSEPVPAAGRAVPDADVLAIETDRADDLGARRAIGADQRFLERGAVAGEPAGDRNAVAGHRDHAGDEIAAVHAQSVAE